MNAEYLWTARHCRTVHRSSYRSSVKLPIEHLPSCPAAEGTCWELHVTDLRAPYTQHVCGPSLCELHTASELWLIIDLAISNWPALACFAVALARKCFWFGQRCSAADSMSDREVNAELTWPDNCGAVHAQLDSTASCSICNDFYDTPLVLPCGHSCKCSLLTQRYKAQQICSC